MTEDEMVDLLDDFIAQMEDAGMDVDQTDRFADVGEWQLAFEGIYAAHIRHPNQFDKAKLAALVAYFDLAPEELEDIAQGLEQ